MIRGVGEAISVLGFAYYRTCSAETGLPSLSSINAAAMWAGVIDVTPDDVPVIDAVKSLRGLHLATWFRAHGFGLGPAAGARVAGLVCGDFAEGKGPFRFSRFERHG